MRRYVGNIRIGFVWGFRLDAAVCALDDQIDVLMAPFAALRDLLDTIPGVGGRAAEVIIAEIGVDMAYFATAAHLASWAGLCPGNNESGGKRRSGRTRKGDTWLRAMLVQCAWSASRAKGTYLKRSFGRSLAAAGKRRPWSRWRTRSWSSPIICWPIRSVTRIWGRISSPAVRIPRRVLAGLCVNWSNSDTRSL